MQVFQAEAARLLARLGWANTDGMAPEKLARLMSRLHVVTLPVLAEDLDEVLQKTLQRCVFALNAGDVIEIVRSEPKYVSPAAPPAAIGKPARLHPLEVWSQALQWAARQRSITPEQLAERFPISKREARDILGLLLLGYTAQEHQGGGICVLKVC